MIFSVKLYQAIKREVRIVKEAMAGYFLTVMMFILDLCVLHGLP